MGFTAETADAFNVGRGVYGERHRYGHRDLRRPESAVQLVAGGLDVTEYMSPGNVVSDATSAPLTRV